MHPYHHSLSSAKKHGGVPADYQQIHDWFDATKAFFGDARHRALRHHTAGIFWCEEKFGPTIVNSNGKVIPTRLIAEQHVTEDMGFLPTPEWWLREMALTPAMNKVPTKPEDHRTISELAEIRDKAQQDIAGALYRGEG
jgi:hypothetical protein